jgi:hypothetical protein
MVETLYAPDYAAIDFAFGFSVLSAAGSLFIIGNWLCNSSARRLFFLRLIVFLAIANLFSSLSYVMSFVEWRVLALHRDDYAAETWCIVQATLLVFFEDVRIAPAPEMYLSASQRHVCVRAGKHSRGWRRARVRRRPSSGRGRSPLRCISRSWRAAPPTSVSSAGTI